MKRNFLLILISLVILLLGLFLFIKYQKKDLINIRNSISSSFFSKPGLFTTQTTQNQTKSGEENAFINSNDQLLSKVNLDVPFIKQAPLAIWDDIHNEACEEASLIAAIKYRQGYNSYSDDDTEKDIQALVNWQDENFGGQYDLPIEKVAEMALGYYDYQSQIFSGNNVTLENIKKQLALGNPVIVPLAGRLINNPYFRSPGPIYHMLVISGYDDETGKFITQDPGTKRGKNYQYSYSTILNSIHNISVWKLDKISLEYNEQAVLSGLKSMLIISTSNSN